MSKMIVEGGYELEGEVKVSGAKNSAVALLPAAILANKKSIIYGVPNISDIKYLIEILELLNCKVIHKEDSLIIETDKLINKPIPEELSVQMRASYYFMGALLSKFKKVEISFPGGCNIGARPIDIHIKGFQALGAKVEKIKNRYIITADELIGTRIYFDFPSVGATINIMLAAIGAKGITIIENAAREPEIVNIASFLISMGAKIRGAGTSSIEIEGIVNPSNAVGDVFPDRIETGTYIVMGALLGKNLTIKGIIPAHNDALLTKLKEIGVNYTLYKDKITISKCKEIKSTNIKTQVYPGFVTDLQQIMTTLLTQANGESYIEETIYENRFKNTLSLNEMGANTEIIDKNNLKIIGPTKLIGTEVTATDLRGGASLLLAALIAKGTTTINDCDYILRGYGEIEEKLLSLGAKIKITE